MKARVHNRKQSVQKAAIAVTPSPRRECILLGLCTLLLCGIYLGKAYNMDDPLVVWTAQRIAAHPADFYGFNVNWYGYSAPMARIDLNPPGAAYYAAIFGALLRWSEPALHIAVALMGVLLVLGIYSLARRMGGQPLLAGCVALVSPGILVSMGTVMTDLLMAAFWIWAVALWLRGLEETHPTLNAMSGLLIMLAALIKYFAMSLVPLLLIYTILSERKRWIRAVWLITPVAAIYLFDLYTQRLYGVGLIRGSVGMMEKYHELYTISVGRKLLTGLTFFGAGGAPALFLAPWLWRRAGRMALSIGAVLIAIFTLALAQSGWQVGEPQISYSWWFWLQYGLWMLAGVHIVALLIAELWNRRDRDSVLLVAWFGGTLFYSVFMYHFVNIRVILPALPVVALLCARRLNGKSSVKVSPLPRQAWAALAMCLVLSLCVAWADITLANSARTAAERIGP